MPRKKNHAKKKVTKKSMQKEGPIVTFSESLSFFRKVWVSEINNIARHNMNKQKSLSFYWKETIRTLFLFQIAASVPTTYTVYWIIIKIIK